MKEHPIIFSTDMVKAILEGRKTMTRRVVTPDTSIVGVGRVDWSKFDWNSETECDFGDLRYSTESEYVPQEQRGELIGIEKAPKPFVDGNLEEYHYQYLHVPYRWKENATIYRIYPKWDVGDRLWVRETWATYGGWNRYKPSQLDSDVDIFYQASFDGRLDSLKWRPSLHLPKKFARITLEITEVRVERLQEITIDDLEKEGLNYHNRFGIDFTWSLVKYVLTGEFQKLWDSINAKRGYGWEVNPWIWVLSFRRLDG